jgi:TPR repeat protein
MDAGTLTPRYWPRTAGRRKAPLWGTLGLIGALVGGIAAADTVVRPGSAAAQQRPAFASAQAALTGGLGAYQAGHRGAAISALTEAAAKGDASEKFVAEFYLARIFSEDVAGGADHTKAFVLFRKLADENVTVDPETSQRAPFVAKALIALAGYVRSGLREIDLAPNPARADDYLHHAAVFFGDRDAQYELARAYLDDDRRGDDVRRGLHYLAALTEASHAPAQALLGELFWHGRYVKKDQRRALALITMATEGAPAHERIWIEDVYATVYCASEPAVREQASLLATRWRTMFARPYRDAAPGATVSATRDLLPERQCANGEKVALGAPSRLEPAAAQPSGLGLLKSAPPPAGFRAAGFIEPATAKK